MGSILSCVGNIQVKIIDARIRRSGAVWAGLWEKAVVEILSRDKITRGESTKWLTAGGCRQSLNSLWGLGIRSGWWNERHWRNQAGMKRIREVQVTEAKAVGSFRRGMWPAGPRAAPRCEQQTCLLKSTICAVSMEGGGQNQNWWKCEGEIQRAEKSQQRNLGVLPFSEGSSPRPTHKHEIERFWFLFCFALFF